MHRALHVLGALKFTPTKAEAATDSALSLFRVLPFESVSSRPYGSFSCRFCGFPEGAFSMASYRSLRGSKGTLGPCRAVCLWLVGLESCWGFPVSHASCTPWLAVSRQVCELFCTASLFSGFDAAVRDPLSNELASPWA